MYEFGHFLRARGISMPQIMLLMHLRHTGPATVSDIGRHLDISNPAASQLIQRLVEQDFLERRESHTDRRVKEILLTEKGKTLIRSAAEARGTWVADLAARLPAASQAEIESVMNLLIKAAHQSGFPRHEKETPS